jgi:hypothetical protein
LSRTITFNGNLDEEPVIVELFGKAYRLKPITKTVQKNLEKVTADLNSAFADEDADGDRIVKVLAEGIDALLGIEGAHRTPAKKVILDRWDADKLSVTQLNQIFEGLQEQEATARPT